MKVRTGIRSKYFVIRLKVSLNWDCNKRIYYRCISHVQRRQTLIPRATNCTRNPWSFNQVYATDTIVIHPQNASILFFRTFSIPSARSYVLNLFHHLLPRNLFSVAARGIGDSSETIYKNQPLRDARMHTRIHCRSKWFVQWTANSLLKKGPRPRFQFVSLQ